MSSKHPKESRGPIEFAIGETGRGEAIIRWTGSNGGKVLGSPNLGKSTLAETIAKQAKRKMPNLRVVIISVTGRFDYDLQFDYSFFSPIRHKDAMFEYLQKMVSEMERLMTEMEQQKTKFCRDLEGFVPELLILDEHESLEECLEKKERDLFAKLVTLRINCGRKLERVTWSFTQSQVLDAVQTRTRSLEYIFLGRPQTKALCLSLGISEDYYGDFALTQGRMLKILGGQTEVVKVWKDV